MAAVASPITKKRLHPHRLSSIPRVNSKDDLCLLKAKGNTDDHVEHDIKWKQIQITTELVNTEKRFVKTLTVLDSFFQQPLEDQKILAPEEITNIFANLRTIKALQHNFLEQLLFVLHKTPAQPDLNSPFQFSLCATLAELFLAYSSHADIFIVYCSSHSALLSQKKLQTLISNNPEFSEFLSNQLQLPVVEKQTLQSMLTTVPQRICKYPLLLREYKKTITPKEEQQMRQIENTIQTLNSLLDTIDKNTKVSSDFGHLLEIQNILILPKTFKLIEEGRSFVHQGAFVVKKPHQAYGTYAFLFSDVLLLCKSKGDLFKVTRIMTLPSLILCANEAESGDSYTLQIAEVYNDIFSVSFIDKESRDNWLDALGLKLTPNFRKNPNKLSKLKYKSTVRVDSHGSSSLKRQKAPELKLAMETSKRKEAEARVKELEAEVKALKKRVKSQEKTIKEFSISSSLSASQPPVRTKRSKSTSSSPDGVAHTSSKNILRSVKERLLDKSSELGSPKRSDAEERDKKLNLIPSIVIMNDPMAPTSKGPNSARKSKRQSLNLRKQHSFSTNDEEIPAWAVDRKRNGKLPSSNTEAILSSLTFRDDWDDAQSTRTRSVSLAQAKPPKRNERKKKRSSAKLTKSGAGFP